jgi:hypothetical protein
MKNDNPLEKVIEKKVCDYVILAALVVDCLLLIVV